ncbi:MAG: SHOCT domain-containing protein [Proteobacteria bacterium]|nr:SHOCT domain-containing protein [Pseudomonadota bacterium]
MMVKRFGLLSAFLSFVLIFAGCSSMDVQLDNSVINREFNKFAKWVEKNTNYDPYGNEIHINRQELRARYSDMIRNINYYASVQFSSINTYVSHCNTFEDDWRCVRRDRAITKSQIGDKWRKKALKNFRADGFVVTQKDIPEGNLNFGSFSVPVQLTIGIIGSDSSTANLAVRKHNFTIKKHVSVPQSQPKVIKSSTKKELSVAERLKMLKQMLDDGLITEDEFKNKKSKLLEDL